MDKTIENNMRALLKECVTNGENGPLTLYAWFCGEREFINRTIKEESLEDYGEE